MIVHPFETVTVDFAGRKVTFKALTNLAKISRDKKASKFGTSVTFAGYNPKRIQELSGKIEKLNEGETEELIRLYKVSETLEADLYLRSVITLQYVLESIEGIELVKEDEPDSFGRVNKIVSMQSIIDLDEKHGIDLIGLAFEGGRANSLTDEEKKSLSLDSTLKNQDGTAEVAGIETKSEEAVS